MATKTLTLFCLISGDSTSNAFSVKIPSNDTVDDLKNLIKTKQSPDFDDIIAKNLALWRVSIPDDDDDLPILLDSVSGKKKLKATTKLSKVFDAELPEDTIHIVVERLQAKDNGHKNFTISLDSPAKKFSSYTWKDAQSQYGVQEFELMPAFDIQPKPLLENEKAVLKHIVEDCVFKNKAYLLGPGASEATKSSVVDTFMVGAIQSYGSEMFLAQQRPMSGMRGHGAVDFAVVDRVHQSQVLGVTEVKKEDYAQGLAQNMAELDVAVQQKKRKRIDEVDEDSGERIPARFKSYGIVTDSFKWTLVECALDEGDVLSFRVKDIPGVLDLKQTKKEDVEKDCEKVFSYVLALYQLMKVEIVNRSTYGSPSTPPQEELEDTQIKLEVAEFKLKNAQDALAASEEARRAANRDRVIAQPESKQEVFAVLKFTRPQPLPVGAYRLFALQRKAVRSTLDQFIAKNPGLDAWRGQYVYQHMMDDKRAPIKLSRRRFVVKDGYTEDEMKTFKEASGSYIMGEALEYDVIVQNYWKFLHNDWPIIDRLAAVNDIESIKKFVLNRLGVIPVFFFLTMILGTRAYSCPYRNIEKGVMLLYVLAKGVSLSDIAQYVPKTSFHTIHKEIYMYNPVALNRLLTTMLSEMFSTLKSRHLAAERNLDPFKNVTLNLDGHDSRIIYVNADKPSLYSYKLKKSGFRVQVCIDMNSMVLFVSAPAPCKDYNDGTMLLRMGIQNKIYRSDCVALDNGYNLFIGKLLDSADELQYENFCYPIRKMRGIALTEEEKAYNEIFGSFRSRIESYFGEMQSTFTKFSHTVVNKVAEKETFVVQYKLACLLMNIKRFVALMNISTEQHHTLWLQDGFDYPNKTEQETVYTLPNIKVKLSQSQDLLATRKVFFDMSFSLSTGAADDDMALEDDDRANELKAVRESIRSYRRVVV
ncbi:hypothetical protein BGZ91_006145 [Linnemannia elongata]|nr:hypothetical protein BGZ91_006145 [Linnemannia elongata]